MASVGGMPASDSTAALNLIGRLPDTPTCTIARPWSFSGWRVGGCAFVIQTVPEQYLALAGIPADSRACPGRSIQLTASSQPRSAPLSLLGLYRIPVNRCGRKGRENFSKGFDTLFDLGKL